MSRTIVVSSFLAFFACIYIVFFMSSSTSPPKKSKGSIDSSSPSSSRDETTTTATPQSISTTNQQQQQQQQNDLSSSSPFSTPDDAVVVSSPNTCEIHGSPTTSSDNKNKKKTSMKIWKPKLCGSLWNLEQTWSFPILNAVGWNITNGRRVVPDEARSISEKDRCAAYDTGVFVEVNENNNQATKKEQPWRHADLPPAVSIVSGNGNRLAPFEPKDLLGSNLASFISKRMFATTSTSTSSGPSTNSRLPPWIVMIGDSRSRHLLARLSMMIRSSFAPAAAEKNDDGENAIHAEMRRHGVIEHYFHLNATYTVFGRVIDEETGEMEPTSDRFHIIPEGFGCPTDDVAMTGKDEKNCSSSEKENNSNSSNKIRIMIRICLWWHVSTFAFLEEGPRLLGKDLGAIGAVTWMPTLHECMGRNRRGLNHQGKRKKGGGGKYTQCLFPPQVIRESVPKFIKMILKETNAKNFVILSAPNSLKAPKNVVAERNQHLVLGLNDFVAEAERKPSATIRPLTSIGSEESNNNKKKKNKNDRQTRQQQQRQVWYLDMANWWVAAQPTVCDKTHTMCNLNPHRPERAERVTFFCGGCRDEMGFVSMREILRLLLA